MTDEEYKKNAKPVKRGWFEGNDMHIINTDGVHIIFRNCEVTEYVDPESDDADDGIGNFQFKAKGRIEIVK